MSCVALGRVESDVMVDQFFGGALQPLLDRFFVNQQARAISEIPNPQSVFKVRAIWFSRVSSG